MLERVLVGTSPCEHFRVAQVLLLNDLPMATVMHRLSYVALRSLALFEYGVTPGDRQSHLALRRSR